MKEVSKYKNNKCTSIKKHILAILCDYFLTFIASFLLFSIFYPIASLNGRGSEITQEMNSASLKLKQYINNTHLRTYDEKADSLSDSEADAIIYITNIVKTSAYVFDLNYPVKKEDGTYDLEHKVSLKETFINDALNYPLDNISYYNLKFKPTEPSIKDYVYNDVTYTTKSEIETYQYLKVMQYEKFSSIDSVFVLTSDASYIPYKDLVSRYVVLNKDLAKKFINKIVFGETLDTDSENTYTSLKNCYYNALEFAGNELEGKCTTFIDLNNQYVAAYNKLILLLFVVLICCYFGSYLLLTVIPRLVFKEWITIGMKVFKLSFTDSNEMEPGINLLPYHILTSIMYFSSTVIALLFTGLIGVLNTAVTGPITLFSIIIFILVLDVLSIIFLFFNKRHSSLCNFVCLLQVKDTTEFEGPVEDSAYEQN